MQTGGNELNATVRNPSHHSWHINLQPLTECAWLSGDMPDSYLIHTWVNLKQSAPDFTTTLRVYEACFPNAWENG